MTHLLLVYLHLIATCAAVGVILAADLRAGAVLLDRLRRPDARCRPLRLPPPDAATVRVIAASLAVLVATGIGLVVLAVQARPDALANPKLQAKVALVVLLVLNAAALHRVSLPALAGGRARRERPPGAVARWRTAAVVAGPVAVSHGLWAYCAFLGIARPWNFRMPIEAVLAVGAGVVGIAWLGLAAVLAAATAPGYARLRAVPTLSPADDDTPAEAPPKPARARRATVTAVRV